MTNYNDNIMNEEQYTLTKTKYVANAIATLNRPLSDLTEINSSTPAFLKLCHLLRKIAYSMSWLNAILSLFNHIVHIATALTISKKSAPTRAMTVLTSIGLVAIGIASLIMTGASYPLMLASACIDLFQKGWHLMRKVKSYFAGNWRRAKDALTQDTARFYALLQNPVQLSLLQTYRAHPDLPLISNHPKENDIIALDKKLTASHADLLHHAEKVANKSHAFVLSAIAVAGTALLFTPLVFVGAGILIGTAVYAVLDKFNLNPLRWLANKILRHPFQAKSHHASMAKIENNLVVMKQASSTARIAARFGISTTSPHKDVRVMNATQPTSVKEPRGIVNDDVFVEQSRVMRLA